MKVYIAVLSLLTVECSLKASPVQASGFPTEVEVTSFLKVGMPKREVANKFGEPLDKTTETNGDEVYYYVQPPSRATNDAKYVYSGFEVFFRDNAVSDFRIIHKDVKAPPKA